MKERDIIYGAWLNFFGSHVQITGIQEGQLYSRHTGWVDIAKFEPIPITEEILAKNGFTYWKEKVKGRKQKKEKIYKKILRNEDGTARLCCLYLYPDGTWRNLYLGKQRFTYVHQLQYAYNMAERDDFVEIFENWEI